MNDSLKLLIDTTILTLRGRMTRVTDALHQLEQLSHLLRHLTPDAAAIELAPYIRDLYHRLDDVTGIAFHQQTDLSPAGCIDWRLHSTDTLEQVPALTAAMPVYHAQCARGEWRMTMPVRALTRDCLLPDYRTLLVDLTGNIVQDSWEDAGAATLAALGGDFTTHDVMACIQGDRRLLTDGTGKRVAVYAACIPGIDWAFLIIVPDHGAHGTEAHHVIARLKTLSEIGNTLALTNSVDSLCRQAVELGRDRLGFERIAIWLMNDSGDKLYGTWGVDEHGQLRCERDAWQTIDPSSLIDYIVSNKERIISRVDTPLYGDRPGVVGRGMHAVAAIWNGNQVIGCLCIDNLLTGRPITNADCDLLELYAVTLGHLHACKHAEAAERQSNEILCRVIDTSPGMIWMVSNDASYTPLYLSGNVEAITGYPREAFLQGQLCATDIVPPEDLIKVNQVINTAVAARKPFHAEVRLRRPDGSTNWILAIGQGVFTEQGELAYLMGTAMDITDRKQAEARERAVHHLQELEYLRAQFLTNISHELKTPLTPIIGAIDLLKSGDIGAVNERQQQALEMAERQSHRLHRLINDLLDLFQLESGRLTLIRKPADLTAIIAQSMAAYDHLYQEKGLYLRAEYIDSQLFAEVDEKRFRQIIDSLLDSALKLTQQGGVQIVTTREEENIRIDVSDTGLGLAPGTADRVFDEFFQVERRDTQGLGLGLAMVRGLVETHDGAIHVQSKGIGHGTTFTIFLPLINTTGIISV